jgi:hypothetical protein
VEVERTVVWFQRDQIGRNFAIKSHFLGTTNIQITFFVTRMLV